MKQVLQEIYRNFGDVFLAVFIFALVLYIAGCASTEQPTTLTGIKANVRTELFRACMTHNSENLMKALSLRNMGFNTNPAQIVHQCHAYARRSIR